MTLNFLPSRFKASTNTKQKANIVVNKPRPVLLDNTPYEMSRVIPFQLVSHQENFDWLYRPRYLDDFEEMLHQAIEDLIL